MKNTINTSYQNKNTEIQSFNNTTDNYKNRIENTINNDVTEQLATLFGLNKEQINKITTIETKQLSNNNEVNTQEAQLAKMFGKYNELIALNNPEYKQPLSINSVMQSFDKHEAMVA